MIARWPIEPLRRSRRGLDERLLLAAPWLARLLSSLVVRARPGSHVRRVVLSRTLRTVFAANNRGDYAALSPWLSAKVELHLYPDAPEARPADLEPVYNGRESYVESGEVWKAGFGEFGLELREVLDPGGSRFAARVEMVGRGSATGIETRLTQFHVWQFERGVLRRHWVVASEAAMLALLEGTQGVRSRATAPDPPA